MWCLGIENKEEEMTENEDLIDELCAELQQLYTELEKVKTVSEGNRGRSITENIRNEKR